MAKNSGLHIAKKNKKDEFYTQLVDIEMELYHYKDHFRGKVVYCNCDDPEYSNFWKYFQRNFCQLGLKRLISTHYDSDKPSYRMDLAAGTAKDGETGNCVKTPLQGDGDFRSPECVEILKEADIVVTNPPFSLFREFMMQLIEHDKKFIILGNQNAMCYKEIFPLFMQNQIWLGQSIHSGDREFMVPKDYPLDAVGHRTDTAGNNYICVKGVRWFTNLDIPKRHERLVLHRSYNPQDYPKYDNYDAINVNKTADIPCNYDGVMGVPITFMDKYNPKQFKIVKFRKGDDEKDLSIHGKCPYFRVLIQRVTEGN